MDPVQRLESLFSPMSDDLALSDGDLRNTGGSASRESGLRKAGAGEMHTTSWLGQWTLPILPMLIS